MNELCCVQETSSVAAVERLPAAVGDISVSPQARVVYVRMTSHIFGPSCDIPFLGPTVPVVCVLACISGNSVRMTGGN